MKTLPVSDDVQGLVAELKNNYDFVDAFEDARNADFAVGSDLPGMTRAQVLTRICEAHDRIWDAVRAQAYWMGRLEAMGPEDDEYDDEDDESLAA